MPKVKAALSSADELKILRKIVDITTSEADLEGVLNEIVKTVNELTQADSVFVYLGSSRDTLILRASKTPHQQELGKITLRLGEGVAGWVAQNNKPVAIREKAFEDPRFKAFDVLPEDRYEALLSVPIVYKGKAIGVVNVQHRKPQDYPVNVQTLVGMIARQLGGVIDHARLFTETKQKALQFDSLNKISQTITSEKYLDEILSLIVVVTAEMLNSKICSIMLLDHDGKELVIKATQSLSSEYKRKANLKVDSSLTGEVIKTRRPLIVNDVREEKKYFYRDMAVKEGLTTMLAVPMVVKDKAIGVINVYTKQPHSFQQNEIDVLQIIANQAAVSVENTKLMDEAFKAKEALETRKLVDRAKGVLMRMHNLSEDAAYRMINKKSMDTCRSMKEIAESILLMAEFEKPGSR